MQNVQKLIDSFDKYIQQGELLNEAIMQTEECIEEGVLTKKLKYSLYTYLTRSQKIILSAEFIGSVEVYMLLQDLPEKMKGDIETHDAIDMISTAIGVFDRSKNIDANLIEPELSPEDANKKVSQRMKLIIKDARHFINTEYPGWKNAFNQDRSFGTSEGMPFYEIFGLDFKKTYKRLMSWQKKVESLLEMKIQSEEVNDAFGYIENNFELFLDSDRIEMIDQEFSEEKDAFYEDIDGWFDEFHDEWNKLGSGGTVAKIDRENFSKPYIYDKLVEEVFEDTRVGYGLIKEEEQRKVIREERKRQAKIYVDSCKPNNVKKEKLQHIYTILNKQKNLIPVNNVNPRFAKLIFDHYLEYYHLKGFLSTIYHNDFAFETFDLFFMNLELIEHALGIIDPQAKIERLEKKVESEKEEKEELRRSQGYGWASKMAHEIKNPISAVSKDIHSLHTYLENNSLLEDPIIKGKKYKVNEVLENATKGANRISNFIAKVNEHGKLAVPTPAKSKLSDMETDIIKKYDSIKEKSDYEKAEIQINIEDKKLSINWDKGQIVQVFENLIGNSFLHGFSGFNGKKEITISMGLGENNSVSIEYNNTGNKLSCVEEEYWQEFKTTNTEEGIGLGMSIVKEIITNHQGTITIDPSSFEKGHKLLITLPLDLNKADKKI